MKGTEINNPSSSPTHKEQPLLTKVSTSGLFIVGVKIRVLNKTHSYVQQLYIMVYL